MGVKSYSVSKPMKVKEDMKEVSHQVMPYLKLIVLVSTVTYQRMGL